MCLTTETLDKPQDKWYDNDRFKYRDENMLHEIGFKNIVAACGRDNIEKKLRNTVCKVVVFADLCAIGRTYRLLMKRCQENENIRFYNYDSFEHLICCSKLFQSSVAENKQNSFSFITLERYYECVLSEITFQTAFQYKHGKPLTKAFF